MQSNVINSEIARSQVHVFLKLKNTKSIYKGIIEELIRISHSNFH